MHSENKQALLKAAQQHVSDTQEGITQEIQKTEATLDRTKKQRGVDPGDALVREKLLHHFSERLDQLHHLFPSPYFVRCDVRSEAGERQQLFFSKFNFSERSVFSWVSAAARLRFCEVGAVTYPVPGGGAWTGNLERKDQFMIVNGKIVFMTSEANEYGRTLVHQEQLSQRKVGFILPEIVEKMEKMQDDVIRAEASGSFLIAGPAGSGKTTLALHRLAYLLQSPETSAQFQGHDMIVFVQDEATRAYFSRLLPDLGIHTITILTFGEWALERLGFNGFTYVRRPNGVEEDVDAYERAKCLALRSLSQTLKPHRNSTAVLEEVYASFLTSEQLKLLRKHVKAKQLDRFDLTVLLLLTQQNGPLTQRQEYLVQKKNFEVIRKQRDVPLQYSLIVVDETQNYLPEQLRILRACITPETRALLYVGDLEQQVLLGTIRNWSDADEEFDEQRRVKLEKVYRNTKPILHYIRSLGFSVDVPEGLRDGTAVIDVECSETEEFARIRSLIDANKDGHTGVLSPSAAYLESLRKAFADRDNVHILTIHESQGVEFERVCLVGIPTNFFSSTDEERLRIKKDLLYVGLTRAMDELHVFGRKTLTKLFRTE